MTGIQRETRRMGLLVGDLLLLARLDQGRPLEAKPVDLTALAGEAVDAAHAMEPGRPLALDAPAVVTVTGDARAPAPGHRQPARERARPHAGRGRGDRARPPRRRERGARGRPTPGRAWTPSRRRTSSSASTAATRRARAITAARASASRSWPRSSRRTAARSRSRARPARARRSASRCRDRRGAWLRAPLRRRCRAAGGLARPAIARVAPPLPVGLDRQAGGDPGVEAADDVGRAREAEPLQVGRHETRLIALVAEHDRVAGAASGRRGSRAPSSSARRHSSTLRGHDPRAAGSRPGSRAETSGRMSTRTPSPRIAASASAGVSRTRASRARRPADRPRCGSTEERLGERVVLARHRAQLLDGVVERRRHDLRAAQRRHQAELRRSSASSAASSP